MAPINQRPEIGRCQRHLAAALHEPSRDRRVRNFRSSIQEPRGKTRVIITSPSALNMGRILEDLFLLRHVSYFRRSPRKLPQTDLHPRPLVLAFHYLQPDVLHSNFLWSCLTFIGAATLFLFLAFHHDNLHKHNIPNTFVPLKINSDLRRQPPYN